MQGRNLAEILTGAVVLVVAVGFLVFAIGNSGRAGTTGGMDLTARFDRIDGLSAGADVRIAGVKVGSVAKQVIDPTTFLAVLTLNVNSNLKLPDDTSAEITSESLLGGKYVALVPGGSDKILNAGGEIKITQSAVSLESLLGKFIFSVTELASSKDQNGQNANGGSQPQGQPARP